MATAYPQPENEDVHIGESQTDGQVMELEDRVHESEEVPFQTAQQLSRKPVVDISTGSRLGDVSDLMFDPDSLQVGAVNITRGGLFNRETETIPASQVTVWGMDYVLVDPNRQGASPSGQEGLLKLSDQLRGRYVVSANGTRIGQIEDVEIDRKGRLHGYRLSQVFIDGPLKESRHIPAGATHSLGKDVLIVDERKIG